MYFLDVLFLVMNFTNMTSTFLVNNEWVWLFFLAYGSLKNALVSKQKFNLNILERNTMKLIDNHLIQYSLLLTITRLNFNLFLF